MLVYQSVPLNGWARIFVPCWLVPSDLRRLRNARAQRKVKSLQASARLGCYPLVNIQKPMERSTIFHGKIHYFYGHGFNNYVTNYQRVFWWCMGVDHLGSSEKMENNQQKLRFEAYVSCLTMCFSRIFSGIVMTIFWTKPVVEVVTRSDRTFWHFPFDASILGPIVNGWW